MKMCLFGLCAALLLVSNGARADDRAAAQLLFDQGRELVKKGAFSEACPKFAESLRLDRGIGTMLWLADCQENNGQTASAWASFKEAAAAAAMTQDPREKIARDRAAVLAPQLPRLTINVPRTVPEIEVRRDGVVAGQAEWGVAIPVDPGPHAIEARSAGHEEWMTTVHLPASPRTLVVEVPILPPLGQGAQPMPLPPPARVALAPAPVEIDHKEGKTQRILGIGLGALGVVGLGVGTFFSLDAKSTYDASNDDGHCLADNRCDVVGASRRDSASSEATLATIVLGTGLVALAGGVVLYLTAPKRAPSAAFSGALVRF